MNDKEMMEQLYDLIADRKSFLSDDPENNEVFLKDIEALKRIVNNYKILRNAAFKSMEEKGENLCIWVNENVKSRKAEILNFWHTDYDDIRCNAILYNGKKPVANIILSKDITTLKRTMGMEDSKTNFNEQYIKNAFKTLIYDSFDNYLKYPKISKCSPLLQEIYDSVCESDASMCHIDEYDWNQDYKDRYSDKDVENLKEEIKKYKLEEVIVVNDGEYKIVGYGDLETRFNDNRNLKNKDKERNDERC